MSPKIKDHQNILESPKYKKEVERLRKIVHDFVSVLSLCFIVTSRSKDFQKNSLFIRNIDDIIQSAVGIQVLLMEGMNNSSRRELRYIIELSIKSLYVDQQLPKEKYSAKINYLSNQISTTSISIISKTKIYMLDSKSANNFRLEVKKAYGLTSKYIHPSIHQIKERINQFEKGIFIGFESYKELEIANNELKTIFALILVFAFQAIGSSFTGDIFVGYLETKQDWEFHKSKYISQIDAYYDYKLERKNKLKTFKKFRKNTVRY